MKIMNKLIEISRRYYCFCFSVCLGLSMFFCQSDAVHAQNVPNPWQPYTVTAAILPPVDICFLNNTLGWILCDSKGFYETQDGGITWNLYSIDTKYTGLKTFRAFDASHWLIGGKGVILQTSDAGNTWSVYTGDMDIYRLDIVDTQKAYASGSPGLILYTEDGGLNWTPWSSDTGVYSGIAHGPANNPVAVGYVTDTCDGEDFEPDPTFWYTSPDAWGYFAKGSMGNMSITTAHYKISDVQFIDSTTGWMSATLCDYYPYWAFNGWISLFVVAVPSFKYQAIYYYTHFNYKTVDGGQTWTPYLIGEEATNNIIHNEVRLNFIDKNNGYALVRQSAYLYRTNDGGRNWTLVTIPAKAVCLNDVKFSDNQNGWLIGVDKAGNGFVWKTSDGGTSWTEKLGGHLPSYVGIYDLNVAGSGTVYALAKSSGNAWYIYGKPVDLHDWYCSFWDIQIKKLFSKGEDVSGFLNQYDYWVYTENDWQSSIEMNLWDDDSNRSQGLFLNCDMNFYNRDTGWACSGIYPVGNYVESIRKTVDGGNTWSTLTSFKNLNYHPYKLFFVDDQKGWVLCEYQQKIFHTQDGGESWLEQNTSGLGSSGYFKDFWFKDSLKGWIVTSDGYLYRTQDGGETWAAEGTPYGFGLKKICFADSEYGYIMGENGNLLGTLDGGDHWILLTPSLEGNIEDIVFSPDGTGWMAMSDSSQLLYYLPSNKAHWDYTSVPSELWELLD